MVEIRYQTHHTALITLITSRAPGPQEGVVAVQALLARLGPQPAYQRCGLAHFIEQLDTQLTQVLRNHWP